jgi:hypothetical protein
MVMKRHKHKLKRRYGRAKKRELSVFDKHQLKIARDSLRMPDAMLGVMGGPSKAEAREIIKRLTGKEAPEYGYAQTKQYVIGKWYDRKTGTVREGLGTWVRRPDGEVDYFVPKGRSTVWTSKR